MADSPENEQCKTCKYFKPTPLSGRPNVFGQCHRYAPRWSPQAAVAMTRESNLTYLDNGWPIVKEDSFCGDYNPAT